MSPLLAEFRRQRFSFSFCVRSRHVKNDHGRKYVMKIHRIICLGAAIVVPQLALAKLPFTTDVFGKSEGTLDFCEQINPQSAPKYQQRKKALVRDVPEKELVDARKSQDYKDSYDWITGELKKVSKEQALEACKGALESGK
jgi:hypothetical protein